MTDAKIMIVEDNAPGTTHLEECLKNLGYTVCAAVSCGRQALEKTADTHPDLALVNLCLGGEITGPEVAEQIGNRFDIPVLYLTDEAEGDLLQQAQATNSFGYVLKPFGEQQLHLNILTALSMHERESRHKETKIRLKETINKLEDVTHLMEAVFNSMDEGVVAVDENGGFIFNNSSAGRIAGEHPEPIEADIYKWAEKYGIFKPDGELFGSLDDSPLGIALRGGTTDEVEIFLRNEFKPEGVHIRVSSRPLLRETGVLKGAILVFRDITTEKKVTAELNKTMGELRYQSELMDTSFKSISDGIVVADAEGKFLYANPGAEHIVGMGITDGILNEWVEKYGIYYPDRDTSMKTEDLPLVRAIHHGESTDEQDLFIRNRNRSDGVFIRMSGWPLLDNTGGIRGGVIIFRDVTKRVLAAEALERAFAQGRMEIVDTILHNIGNAITSVTTGIETVHRTLANNRDGGRLSALAAAIKAHREDWINYIENDPQGQKVMPFIIELAEDFSRQNGELMKTVSRVRDRANRIADIIRTQKALDSSNMDRKDIDLQDALASPFRVLRESLNKREIHTSIDCENAPQEIRIQESQFHQMLINLVKNSIEAIDDLALAQELDETPRIGIEANIRDDFFNLEVIDSGIGIKNKDTRVIFSPGYTTKESGTGLGLHSTANFVISCGGKIQALSEGTGKGTTMRVMLPLSSIATSDG